MRLVRPVLAIVLSSLLAPAGAWAQTASQPPRHVADRTVVDQMLTAQAGQERADRDAVRNLLQRPEVRDIAGRYGLSIERADAAVETITGDQLHQLASQARQADRELSGGASTVVISTTTIIIVLLVVILLIVALR